MSTGNSGALEVLGEISRYLRACKMKTIAGVLRYEPGQHKVFVDPTAPSVLILLYINADGHFCVMPCKRENGELTHLDFVCRHGDDGEGRWERLPECFTLTDELRELLEKAEEPSHA